MELWLPIILIVAILILILIFKTVKHKQLPPNNRLIRSSAFSIKVMPYIKEEIDEHIKKKKKKKTKKVKDQEPIIEIPQEEESQDEQPPIVNPDIGQEKQQAIIHPEVVDNARIVLAELQMIRGCFPKQLRQIVPYNGKIMGAYQIQLSDPYGSSSKSQVLFHWKYNKDYPTKGLQIELKDSTYLTRLDADIIKQNVQKLKLGSQLGDNPLFEMISKVFRRVMELGRPGVGNIGNLSLQESKTLALVNNERSQIEESNQKILDDKQQAQIEESIGNQSEQKKSRLGLGALVNQMVFYPGDMIEAPQWGDSETIEQVKPNKVSSIQMRYKRQFQEIKKIGEGGFGRVYLAKNKFDQNIYAVKKCLLNEADPKYKKTIKEVTLLSQLNHPNIVRYHQSWTEEVKSIEELINELEIQEQQQKQLEQQFRKWRHDKIEIEFAESEKNDNDSDSLEDELDRMQDLSVSSQGIVFGNFTNQSRISSNRKKSRRDQSMNDSSSSEENKSHLPFKILYIAMEYCGQHTLKDWIQKMKNTDPTLIQQQRTFIFRQILEALVYIHDRKIIHRDLKPPNIFWDQKKNKIKLGDFGVATNLNQDKFNIIRHNVSQDRIEISDKTKGVGTPIYRAPEQFKSGKYNEKADIFSLGIILFQMNYTFKTKMQRQQLILQLSKNGTFPSDFKNIEARKLIKSLISENPAERPSARSLLLSVRNNYFGQIVSTITNPRHFQFRQLMSCIFKIQNHSTKCFQYEAFNHFDYKQLEYVFQCHGGSNLHLSPLIPVQDFVVTNRVEVAKKREGKFLLISHEGVVMQLSNNGYQPWIKWLLDTLNRNSPKRVPCLRRYSFAQTLQNKNGVFVQKRMGVFDLIYPTSYTSIPLQYECEVIRMTLEIHKDFENTVITLGHSEFIRLFCIQNKIDEELLYGILYSEQFTSFQQMTLQKKLEQLKKYNLQQAICHKILSMLDISAPNLQELQRELKQSLVKSSFQHIISHLQELIKLLQLLNVSNIAYKVGIPPEHCTGIYWTTPRLRAFASIQSWHKQELGSLHVEVDLQQISRPMPDVYVWSVGEYLQKDILQIVTKCWDAGLHTQWSKSPRGEKVQNVKIGVILKRGQKKVMISIKNFENTKDSVDWSPKDSFCVDQIFNLLKNQNKNLGYFSKDSRSKQ